MDGYVTKAKVNLVIDNNMTWIDAFQFGTVGDTTWSFTGQNFRLDIKGNRDQTAALLSLTSGAGTIVVDDVVQRILHVNVPESAIVAVLLPGEYVYELMMYDNSVPAVRVPLMGGRLIVNQGITGG